jgi:hypothetical protein
MADNTRGGSQDGADPLIATDEVTHSGDTADVQLTRPVHVTGAEGSKTVVSITDDEGAMWVKDWWGQIPHAASDPADSGVTKIGGHATDFEVTGLPPATGVVENDRVNAALSLRGQQAVILTDRAGNFIETNTVAHDAADAGGSLKIGGKANAAAPADVSANNDRVDAWFLRNGAQVVNLSAAGSLIGGDVTNGLDVDVNRLPALPAGTNNIGDVDVVTLPSIPAGTNNIGDVDILTIAAGDNNIGNVDIVTMPALPAGTNNIGDVDVLTLPGVGGLAAHASPASGNPVYVAGRASAVIPTDVGADGDAAAMWTNRNGATVVLMAPHVGLNSDPWALVHEGAQYTSAQTSTVLVAGGASEKIVVTKVQIQAFATTAGTAILYFGTGAYSRGTNRALFDGEFAPSATLKPGVVLDGPFISGANGDDLLVTTTNALSITFSVWYYVVV